MSANCRYCGKPSGIEWLQTYTCSQCAMINRTFEHDTALMMYKNSRYGKGAGSMAMAVMREHGAGIIKQCLQPTLFEIPRMYDGCTMQPGKREHIPHWHCPNCGAVANTHFIAGEGDEYHGIPKGAYCLGCDLCIYSIEYPTPP